MFVNYGFHQHVAPSFALYGGGAKGKGGVITSDAGHLNRLIKKASSSAGTSLERKLANRVKYIVNGVEHPLHKTLWTRRSSYGDRYIFVPQVLQRRDWNSAAAKTAHSQEKWWCLRCIMCECSYYDVV